MGNLISDLGESLVASIELLDLHFSAHTYLAQKFTEKCNHILFVEVHELIDILKKNDSLTVYQTQVSEENDLVDLAKALCSNIVLKEIYIEILISDFSLNGSSAIAEIIKYNTALKVLWILAGSEFLGVNLGAAGGEKIADALKYNNTLEELNLSYCGLGAQGAIAIANALQSNPNTALKIVHLLKNKIDVEGGIAFAEMLKKNTSLRLLNLWENNLGSKGGIAIAQALEVNNSLEEINLCGNNLDDEVGQAIAKALNVNCVLRVLHLGVNKLGSEGTLAIAEALKNNAYVKEIYLSHNQIANADNEMAIVNALGGHVSLEKIDLSHNSLSSTAWLVLIMGLCRAKNLRLLDLSANWLDEDTVGLAVAFLLQNNTHLEILNLQNTHLRIESLTAICEVLKKNKSLKMLNISANELGEGAGAVMSDMLLNNTSLIELNLAENNIGDKAIALIANALKCNLSLESLILAHNLFTDKGGLALADALYYNTTLEKIDLSSNNGIGKETHKTLAAAFFSKRNIKKINLSQETNPEFDQALVDILRDSSSCKEISLGNYGNNTSYEEMIIKILETNHSIVAAYSFYTPIFVKEEMRAKIAKLISRNQDCYNQLLWACTKGDQQKVLELLKQGVSPHPSPVYLYALRNYLFTTCYSPCHGYYQEYVNSALHLAAEAGHREIVEILLTHGLNLNHKNSDGKTPLDLARENGHLHLVDFFENRTFSGYKNQNNNRRQHTLQYPAIPGSHDEEVKNKEEEPLERKYATLQKAHDKLVTDAKQLEDDYKTLKKTLDNQQKEQMASFRIAQEQQQKELKKLEGVQALNKETISTQETDIAEYKKLASRLWSLIDTFTKDKDILQKDKNLLEVRLTKLKNTKSQYQSELEKLQKERIHLQKQLQQLSAKQQKSDEIENKLAVLETKEQELRLKEKQLEMEEQELVKQKIELERKALELEKKFNEVKSDIQIIQRVSGSYDQLEKDYMLVKKMDEEEKELLERAQKYLKEASEHENKLETTSKIYEQLMSQIKESAKIKGEILERITKTSATTRANQEKFMQEQPKTNLNSNTNNNNTLATVLAQSHPIFSDTRLQELAYYQMGFGNIICAYEDGQSFCELIKERTVKKSELKKFLYTEIKRSIDDIRDMLGKNTVKLIAVITKAAKAMVQKLETEIKRARTMQPDNTEKELILTVLRDLLRAYQETFKLEDEKKNKAKEDPYIVSAKHYVLKLSLKTAMEQIKEKLNGFNATVFLSYSWDSGPLPLLVHQAYKYMKLAGVNALFDIKNNTISTAVTTGFVSKISEVDYVVLMATPKLREKYKSQDNNVLSIEVEEIATKYKANRESVIPVLLTEDSIDAMPEFLHDRVYANLYEEKYYAGLLDIVKKIYEHASVEQKKAIASIEEEFLRKQKFILSDLPLDKLKQYHDDAKKVEDMRNNEIFIEIEHDVQVPNIEYI